MKATITISLNNKKEVILDIDEALELYNNLDRLFSNKKSNPLDFLDKWRQYSPYYDGWPKVTYCNKETTPYVGVQKKEV